MKNIPLAICLLFLQNILFAQKTISLTNPSFEDAPQHSSPPKGWTACGMQGETPCDVQPGLFGCVLAPVHGNTYLGMVTRDNYTWESVVQKLATPLDSSICHTFTVQLASSENYVSYARLTRQEANYNQPVVFQIWGGYGDCDEQVLLGESPVVTHREWRKYRFVMRHLEPKPLTHLMFQAYYPPGKRCQPTMGNLLLDDMSAITVTKCPTDMVDTLKQKRDTGVPVLQSEKELDQLLAKELAAVRYKNRAEVRFMFQCEENYIGLAEVRGLHMTAVAEALRQFPDKKLILRTKKGSKAVLKHRAAFISTYLRQSGLPENQFEVKQFDKNEVAEWKLDSKWLNAIW